MSIKSGISCFSLGKRTVNCIIQELKRYHASCRTPYFGVYRQQNCYINGNYPLLFGKTEPAVDCCGSIEHFNLLSTTKYIRLLGNVYIGQFGQCQTGCYQQLNVVQYRNFCTSQKLLNTSPALENENWGPYLVSRIQSLEESSRFHGYSTLRWGLSVIVVVLTGIYLFRDKLRDNVADEVADVASRSMADENVILKAHDMTKGVLKRLASEPDTIALVSEFLTAVIEQNEVKNSAVTFASNVLNHPQTQEKLQEVMKSTFHSLLNNQETKQLLLEFIKNLIEDPQTKETCNLFLQSLTKDPDIQKMVSEFFKSVLASHTLQMEAISLGREVTNKVVLDKDIQKQTDKHLKIIVLLCFTKFEKFNIFRYVLDSSLCCL